MNVSPYESLVSLASRLDAFEDMGNIGPDNISTVKAIIDRNKRCLEQAAAVLLTHAEAAKGWRAGGGYSGFAQLM